MPSASPFEESGKSKADFISISAANSGLIWLMGFTGLEGSVGLIGLIGLVGLIRLIGLVGRPACLAARGNPLSDACWAAEIYCSMSRSFPLSDICFTMSPWHGNSGLRS